MQVKYNASQCRDDQRWRRTRFKGTLVEFKNDNDQWVPVLRVGPSQYGRGLYAEQPYAVGDYVAAYFGKLVRKDKHPERTSDMIMQSGLKDYVIKGRPSTSISGAVFVNAVRGRDKKKQNVKIAIRRTTLERETEQRMDFEGAQAYNRNFMPMARGNVIPVFVCIKRIERGDQILTDYNWNNKEWQRNLKRRR